MWKRQRYHTRTELLGLRRLGFAVILTEAGEALPLRSGCREYTQVNCPHSATGAVESSSSVVVFAGVLRAGAASRLFGLKFKLSPI